MTTSASVIADSVHPISGARITTFLLRYPRMVHSEFMTHRTASRNASSSRAIPVEKFIQAVIDDPAMPVRWQKNIRGMQGGADLDPAEAEQAQAIWLETRDLVIEQTKKLLALNVHKQIANRMLEPWHHITVVATATNWANMFALRCHEMAQPEYRDLAVKMIQAYSASTATLLTLGSTDKTAWHLPFISAEDRAEFELPQLIARSVARCARTSYNNHDGTKSTIEKDTELHDMLVVAKPLHASPAEHQAHAAELGTPTGLSGNLHRSFAQYRKTLIGECVTSMDDLPDDIKALM